MSELRSIVAEIERIRDAKKDLAKDESRQFAAAKAADIDGKALRTVLKRRAMGAAAAREFDDLVTMYENALGGKAVAAKAIKAGATVREAAKIAGIGYGTAQRSKTQVLDHDPATGEIKEPPAGGTPQPDPTQAAPSSPDDGVPAGDETDHRSDARPMPEGPAPGVTPSPDPDEGWQARDSAGNHAVAVAAIRESIVQRGQARLDAGDIPSFLDRRARHA